MEASGRYAVPVYQLDAYPVLKTGTVARCLIRQTKVEDISLLKNCFTIRKKCIFLHKK
jgi:hypothetical protein